MGRTQQVTRVPAGSRHVLCFTSTCLSHSVYDWDRKHAALVAGDDEINPVFVRECYVDAQHRPPHRFCVSDEHYIPTLLAAHGGLRSMKV